MNYYFTYFSICGILVTMTLACRSRLSSMPESERLCINTYDSKHTKDSLYTSLLKDICSTYQFTRADDILHNKIAEAAVHYDDEALKRAYTCFFLLPELSDQSRHTVKYAHNAVEKLSVDGDIIGDWNLNYALFKYYLESKDSKKAMELAPKLQERAQILAIPECMALAAFAMGEAYDLNGNYKYAIRNLFNAHTLISSSTRTDIKRHILAGISKFYMDHYMIENALAYKIKELELWQPHNKLDSLQYFHDQLGYQDILAHVDDGSFNTREVQNIIRFSKKNHCKKLHIFASAFLRTTLINIDNKADLSQYFNTLDTTEISDMKANAPYSFFLLSAFDLDSKKQVNEARAMYEKALTEVENSGLDDRKSYFHLQYARFLDHQGNINEAGRHYEQAVQYAKKAQNQDFELKASLAADTFYSRYNVPDKAYRHFKNYYRIKYIQTAISGDQDVYKMEISSEQKILENQRMQEESFQKRFNQVQYNLIAIFIFSIFIIMMVSVRFKVHIWFIRVIGYIGVIFAFEFCMIQIDHYVHELVNYTPWKIFAIKVIVISVILPVHHTIEKRLIKFLIERRQSDTNLFSSFAIKILNWFKKLDSPDESHV